jgi:pyruvate,water dikinase
MVMSLFFQMSKRAIGMMFTSTAFICWFEDCIGERSADVGNKLSGLGRMLNDGVPVPPGFAVTRQAYEYFLENTGVGKQIKKVVELSTLSGDTRTLAESIREQILVTPLPSEIELAIARAYEELAQKTGRTSPEVAVRSSATAEDMPDASFAGLQDTFLAVVGVHQVLANVQRCWASLFTERAVNYRLNMGYSFNEVSISVGIQLMVAADTAGVLFTINPTTGNPFEMVIEANWGLGESVVQGLVTPDQYLVHKKSLDLVREEIGTKHVQVVQGMNGGTTIKEVLPDYQTVPCLSSSELKLLGDHGRSLETKYGIPLDIEWALSELRTDRDPCLHFLQVRPITTHYMGSWHKDPQRDPTDHIIDLLLSKRFSI